eukprot:5663113-Pyramimonas_sp.AAC.1
MCSLDVKTGQVEVVRTVALTVEARGMIKQCGHLRHVRCESAGGGLSVHVEMARLRHPTSCFYSTWPPGTSTPSQ